VPAGATTNSDSGVTDLDNVAPAMEVRDRAKTYHFVAALDWNEWYMPVQDRMRINC